MRGLPISEFLIWPHNAIINPVEMELAAAFNKTIAIKELSFHYLNCYSSFVSTVPSNSRWACFLLENNVTFESTIRVYRRQPERGRDKFPETRSRPMNLLLLFSDVRFVLLPLVPPGLSWKRTGQWRRAVRSRRRRVEA